MLYQILVSELPFPGAELRKAGMLEIQRILREVDPPKPSTRVTKSGAAASALADARQVSLGALSKALRTDLDWVVLKALEKDRNRRYDTANALSADLRRYLDHEPLVAGPPSASYRLQKLLRRYRGQFVAAGSCWSRSSSVARWRHISRSRTPRWRRRRASSPKRSRRQDGGADQPPEVRSQGHRVQPARGRSALRRGGRRRRTAAAAGGLADGDPGDGVLARRLRRAARDARGDRGHDRQPAGGRTAAGRGATTSVRGRGPAA